MNFTQIYESFQALENPSFWQDIYMRFYRAWFEGGRWMQYFEGLGTTILVTILALLIGVILGVVVAVIRTGHDQQRKGKHNPILAVLNIICKIYVTVIRGGLMSLDPGQMEAGRSLGLGYLPTMTFIVVPQAFKAILPALGNEFITLLKDTSLISAIAGKEVVYFAKAIGAKTYDYMFPLLIIAVMYLILVLIFTWLQGILERRLRASDRR